MRFGLFGGARTKRMASSNHAGLGDSHSYRGFIDYVIEAERLGFESVFLVEHHFTGAGQVSVVDDAAGLSRGTDAAHPVGHRGGGAAVAQSGAGRGAGGDAGFAIGRAIGSGGGQRVSRAGVRWLLHSANGSDGAVRRSARGDPQRLGRARADSPIMEALALSRTWSWNRSRYSGRTRPCGWPVGSPDSIRRAAREGFNLLLDQLGSTRLTIERVAMFREEFERVGRAYDPSMVAAARALQMVHTDSEREDAYATRAQTWKVIGDLSRGEAPPEDIRKRRLAVAGHAGRDRGEARAIAGRRGRDGAAGRPKGVGRGAAGVCG